MENKNVYIKSLEASDIISYMERGTPITNKYVGTIPFSLELLKLEKEKLFSTRDSKVKVLSDDIINVKFTTKLKTGNELLKDLQSFLANVQKKNNPDKYSNLIEKLNGDISSLEAKIKENPDAFLKSLNTESLRNEMYSKGFAVNGIDYKIYKRSSSKSREGEVLAIKAGSLYDRMILWSRMGLDLFGANDIDFPSLLASESLVLSGIEGTIQLNVDNILLIQDVDSVFKYKCDVVENVTEKKENNDKTITDVDRLRYVPEANAEIKNSLYDGQSILDEMYYNDCNSSMKLLRGHHFKSAAFRGRVRQFLIDYAEKNTIDFDTWEITTPYHSIMAKDVHMITTPNSLKALRITTFEHWKKVMKEEGCIFGVVKHEKESKRGLDKNGDVVQSLSYQIVNSLGFNTEEEIRKILEYDLEVIEKLKNDDHYFLKYIEDNASNVTCNKTYATIARHNIKFMNTKFFKDFRSKEIFKYKTDVKSGHVKISKADYCVLFGNPLEMLYSAVGVDVLCDKYYNNTQELKGNQVYTTLFEDNEELAMFRNPHTASANCLYSINELDCEETKKYFDKISNNVVIVNTVKFPLPSILSGSDFDSDNAIVTNFNPIVQKVKSFKDKYLVAVNNVEKKETNKYSVNMEDMAKIDHILSGSQRAIGEITNVGQWLLSSYWHEKDDTARKSLLKGVQIASILQGVAIDQAKRLFKVDLQHEIRQLRVNKSLPKFDGKLKKPLFFKCILDKENKNKVKRAEKLKNKTTEFSCPMDLVCGIIDEIKNAESKGSVEFLALINKKDINPNKANRKQLAEIVEINHKFAEEVGKIKDAGYDEETEFQEMIEAKEVLNILMRKKKIKTPTFFKLLSMIGKYQISDVARMLTLLYDSDSETLLSLIKKTHKKSM